MNLGPARGNICYVLDGGERVMSAVQDSTKVPNAEQSAAAKSATRKPYPGATLRHLGSVRDVTLVKTKSIFEVGFGNRHN
jgi:hypothetical protein